MSAVRQAEKLGTGAKVGLSLVGAFVVGVGIVGGVVAAAVVALALLGAPLFAIMGGASELAWLLHPDAAQHFLNRIAPTVLDEERFAGSPILVTIPLFTFVGYLMAESKTPGPHRARVARPSSAGCLGGLAIVCIVASAFFTTLTGGSGVTIVAIGGLLYPALRKQGYSDAFALGLVTTGGSLGLLLPPSLPILVYSLVAGIDFNKTFKAGLSPGLLVMVLLGVYSAYVGKREKVRLESPRLGEAGRALWMLKWELMTPVIILGGLASGLTQLDESAGLAAPLHADHRGLRLQGPLAQEGPAAHRQGVDGAGRRRHPHPCDGQRAHQLRHPAGDPDARARRHAAARPVRDLAVPHRDERLPARPRHADGRVQRRSSSPSRSSSRSRRASRSDRSTWR